MKYPEKKSNDKLSEIQILVPVLALFTLTLVTTTFNALVKDFWINLTFGCIVAIIMSFIIYFVIKKMK